MVWDWPEDDREDRAKRVALAYRQLAVQILRGETADPMAALAACDEHWLAREQHWIIPSLPNPYDDDDWITAKDAAHYTGLTAKAIRKWAERGHITARAWNGSPVYNVGEIRAHKASRIRDRIQRATHEQAVCR